MGKLLALELFNFKSYRGHHILQFGDSYFTSVIGPNGSGKSNSMDAISFVLGIKSSHLRSTHMKDLIYRGRVLKHSKIDADGDAVNGHVNGDVEADPDAGTLDGDEAPANTQRNDPQTAWVMAVYEDDAGEEQRWKRSITSSGASEYRINNRVVSAKQYNDALEAENILIKARNFLVFQGDVEQIASQSPSDLTRQIEQISGSIEYKKEYERLRAEKDKADEEQQHRLQLRRGINGEIKQYQEQKAELDHFEELREQKDQSRVTHILWKLFHLQRTIEDSAAEIQKHQEELKEYRRNVKKYEDRLEAAKSEQAKVGRNVNNYERQVKQKEKTAQETENSLLPIDEKLAITSEKIKTKQRVITNITAERDSQQQGVDKFQESINTTKKAQKRWEDDWQVRQQQTGRALSDNDRKEYLRLSGEVSKRSGDDQLRAENLERQLKTDEGTVDSLKSRMNSSQSHVKSMEAEIAGLDERYGDFKARVKSTAKEIELKKKQINEKTSARERARQKHNELEEKLQEVLKKLDEARGFERESQKEAQQREMFTQLKRLYPTGVKGFIRQLCKPKQKKYETAIATVFGRHWDAIVVDTAKTAQDCCQYLREQRIGRMMFIPLDTVIHEQPNTNLRGMQQGVRLAIDTIDYEANVERAISYVCGTSIITDTLEIARQICYGKGFEVKAVALDGTMIHKGGNMTGGEDSSDKKRRFEVADMENLYALINNYRAEIEKLPKGHKNQAEEEQLLSELTGLEERSKYAQDEMKALGRNLDSKQRELDHVKTQLTQLTPKYNEAAEALEELRQSLQEHRSTVEDIQDNVFASFCQRLGYANIREYEAQQGSMQIEAEQERNRFVAQLSRLENQVNFETTRLRTTTNRIAAAKAEIQRDEKSVAELQKQKGRLADDLDVVNAEIEQLNEQVDALRSDYEEHGKAVAQARSEVNKRSSAVESALKAVTDLEAEIATASTARHSQLRTCKVENVQIPLEQGSRKLNALPTEAGLLDSEEDEMEIDNEEGTSNAQFNDFGILVDFSSLSDELQDDPSADREASLAEHTASLTSELDKMAPNMRSADRLEATEQRFRATEREFKDSQTAAKRAARDFASIKQKRMDLFNKAFAHISDQIGTVYRELTKTTSFPLGGQATLGVEDDDEPYLSGVKYHAMPPLKRFRDMEHLSGGEKTMAALALLFAIHTYAPSPFFVLDEVDAALDNANTAQLAQYVREHAGPGMQFVVISLKTGLFQNSETLVGVMRDQTGNSSRALTLDLRRYQPVASAA